MKLKGIEQQEGELVLAWKDAEWEFHEKDAIRQGGPLQRH